jgi:N-acetylmuramoyl-L-alanine amidase
MRSYGRRIAATTLAFALVSGSGRALFAQTQTAAAERYENLQAQEVRISTSSAAAAEDFRVVINRYWTFVRRYPTNGLADNALWQAATLSMSAFARFGEDRDHYRAIQLFQWLRDQYPHSRFRVDATAHIDRLAAVQVPSSGSVAPQLQLHSPPAATETTIRAVHRESLPEVVRVTIELDREVPFYQERIEGPSRLFFDLKGTRTVPALSDATFRYDSDVVRHIRLGRHPNNTTRIVLDLENVGRYSVFTLYNPYRIVIDSERAPASSRTYAAITPTPRPKVVTTPPIVPDVETAGTRSASSARSTARRVSGLPAANAAANRPVVRSLPDPPPARTVNTDAAAKPAAPVPAESTSMTVMTGKPIAPSTNSSGKFSVARQLGLGVSRVVIDAGHGGHDPGASAFGQSEAELVLDVALRLEKLLLLQPGTEVFLTRRTNDFLSLEERTEIANRQSADLFLSIHANASANATAGGVETYFLNFALNPQAEAVAARENAASGKTMNSLPGIIKAITLNSKVNESRDFAASVQRALVRGLRPSHKGVRDLGVKQAPFMVLIGAAMPSALAEISFVTNRQESRLLKTESFRQKIAESLLAGILRYQQSLKKVQTAALQ